MATKPSSSTRRGSGLLICNQSFRVAGGPLITKGTVVEASDPVVQGREHMFTKAEDRIRNTRK